MAPLKYIEYGVHGHLTMILGKSVFYLLKEDYKDCRLAVPQIIGIWPFQMWLQLGYSCRVQHRATWQQELGRGEYSAGPHALHGSACGSQSESFPERAPLFARSSIREAMSPYYYYYYYWQQPAHELSSSRVVRSCTLRLMNDIRPSRPLQ